MKRIKSSALALALTTASVYAIAQSGSGQDALAWRIMKWSEADQVSWINSTLNQGVPPDLGGALSMLILNRSSTTLPLIEKKIEQVIKSPTPAKCFSTDGIDPKTFVTRAAVGITEAGDEQSLREAGKLLAIDAHRFGDLDLVGRTLGHAENYRNPFSVAYRGLEIGDPAIDRGIAAWAESEFGSKSPIRIEELTRKWATAMVDRYNGVPAEGQWTADPIVRSLKPSEADRLHQNMIRFAQESVEKRPK